MFTNIAVGVRSQVCVQVCECAISGLWAQCAHAYSARYIIISNEYKSGIKIKCKSRSKSRLWFCVLSL